MTRSYKQHIQDLEKGMAQIEKVIKKTKNLDKYDNAMKAKDIQQTRIQSFKEGYWLAKRENNNQKTLNLLGAESGQ